MAVCEEGEDLFIVDREHHFVGACHHSLGYGVEEVGEVLPGGGYAMGLACVL